MVAENRYFISETWDFFFQEVVARARGGLRGRLGVTRVAVQSWQIEVKAPVRDRQARPGVFAGIGLARQLCSRLPHGSVMR